MFAKEKVMKKSPGAKKIFRKPLRHYTYGAHCMPLNLGLSRTE
jgi:hypothetical protein